MVRLSGMALQRKDGPTMTPFGANRGMTPFGVHAVKVRRSASDRGALLHIAAVDAAHARALAVGTIRARHYNGDTRVTLFAEVVG